MTEKPTVKMNRMKASDLFEQKYGNRLSESESWVLRFAEQYAKEVNKDLTRQLRISHDVNEARWETIEKMRCQDQEILSVLHDEPMTKEQRLRCFAESMRKWKNLPEEEKQKFCDGTKSFNDYLLLDL